MATLEEKINTIKNKNVYIKDKGIPTKGLKDILINGNNVTFVYRIGVASDLVSKGDLLYSIMKKNIKPAKASKIFSNMLRKTIDISITINILTYPVALSEEKVYVDGIPIDSFIEMVNPHKIFKSYQKRYQNGRPVYRRYKDLVRIIEEVKRYIDFAYTMSSKELDEIQARYEEHERRLLREKRERRERRRARLNPNLRL